MTSSTTSNVTTIVGTAGSYFGTSSLTSSVPSAYGVALVTGGFGATSISNGSNIIIQPSALTGQSASNPTAILVCNSSTNKYLGNITVKAGAFLNINAASASATAPTFGSLTI